MTFEQALEAGRSGDRRLYRRHSDGIHWTWCCPTCGKTGRGEGHHRAVRNLAAHCRRYHMAAGR